MNIGIIGVGLIGGSFARALRRVDTSMHIMGIDRDAASLAVAQEMGVIDEAASPAAAAQCDVILLAVPVRQIPLVLADVFPFLTGETVITDAGSTKQDVVAAARAVLGDRISQFVPGHPIAGREHAGVGASDADLFQGKNVVLTPLPENAGPSIERVRSLWQACGAHVVEMTAEAHDAVFAAVSHLPLSWLTNSPRVRTRRLFFRLRRAVSVISPVSQVPVRKCGAILRSTIVMPCCESSPRMKRALPI